MNRIHQFTIKFSLRSFQALLLILFYLFIRTEKMQGQTVSQVVIGNTSGIGTWFYGPLYRNTGNAGTFNYSKYAYLYTSAELGIPPGSKIIKLEWLKKDTGQVLGNNNFKVWIANTSTATFTSPTQWSALVAGSTLEFSSSSYAVTGTSNTYIQVPFLDSFVYGGNNIQILTDWEKFGFATAAVPFYASSAVGKGIGFASTTQLTNASNLQSGSYGNSRPTIRITYVTVPACTGTPNPGNTISNVSTICGGVPFNLSLQNTVNGTQVNYQWQSANNFGFTAGLVNLGTSSTQTVSQTSDKYYRCIVTCAASSSSTTSVPVFVPMSPVYGCYCTSTALSTTDEDIMKFTLGAMKNCSNCSSVASGVGSTLNLYSNYQYITPTVVQQGSNLPFSIEVGVCGSGNYPNRCAIFIDYNQNMSFADPGELVYSSPSSESGAHIEAGNIVIPTSALTGLTGVRVINSEQSGAITNPCLQYSWGETEDYVINILPSNFCNGAPSPGNTILNLPATCAAVSGTYSVCSGRSISLSLSSQLQGTGYSYQWCNSNGYIPGATNPIYLTYPIGSPTNFYCNVTCNNSNITVASTPISITMDSYLNCYCSSGAALPSDEDILSVTVNGITNASDCITITGGVGSVLNEYSNFTSLGNFATLILGNSVPFSIIVDDCDVPPPPYYPFGTGIWIDFNHNGSFSDPGEEVFIEQAALIGPRTITGTINIPCSAMSGQTRMRITAAEGLADNALTPCVLYGFGETEDYLVNLVPPVTCLNPVPSPGNTESNVSVFCDSTIAILSLQNKCLLNNYSYQWFRNGTAILGATSYTYTVPKLSATATFYCTVSCGNNSASSAPFTITSINITVGLNASSTVFCSPSGTPVVLTASGATSYTYLPSNSLSSSSGTSVSATPTATTTYTVTGSDGNGCVRTSTVTIQVIPCSLILSLKFFIQGYYSSASSMVPALFNQGVSSNLSLSDSVTIELRNSTPPYALAASKRAALLTNGSAIVTFPSLTGSYYVVIKHRNALETWSAVPVSASSPFYDFTTSANKAYGNNMVQVSTNIWALYSGELNGDGNIDLLDLTTVETDINNFVTGYASSDVNGDGNVDLIDIPNFEPNINNFIFSNHP